MFMARIACIVFLLVAFSLASSQRTKQLTVMASADHGVVLYLSDGSAWEIRQENRAAAAGWPMHAPVGVYRTEDRDFPFRLVRNPGKADGSVLSAKRLYRLR
jgi:hypothetical protein